MIESTAGYKAAITADARRTLLKAIINISDPDMTYGAITSSGESPFSRAEQLIDKEFSPSQNYVTLEKHRWLLNGKCKMIPESNSFLTSEFWVTSFTRPKFMWSSEGKALWGDYTVTLREVRPHD